MPPKVDSEMPRYIEIIQTTAIVSTPVLAFGTWLQRTIKHMICHEVSDLIDGRLASIKTELAPNGGGSLRDKVNDIATAVDRQRVTDDRRHRENLKRLENAETHLEQQDTRIDQMHRALLATLRSIKPLSDEALVELDRLDRPRTRKRKPKMTGQGEEQ